MKKLLAIAGVTASLMAAGATTATAGTAAKSLNFGSSGLTITIGDGRYYDRYGDRYRDRYDERYRHGYRHGRYHHDILPLPRVVRIIERRTGGTVTKISLAKHKRFYRVEGYGRRGAYIRAKADPYTAELYDIRRHHKKHHYGDRGDWRHFSHWRPGLERLHYHGFGKPKRHERYWEVDAYDRRGRHVNLEICGYTGRVLDRHYY